MTVFFYDKTFEGLLSTVYDAYSSRKFPQKLLKTGDVTPLFAGCVHTVITDGNHAVRVWRGLRKKLTGNAANMLLYVYLSEQEGSDELLFRYICKVFDVRTSVALNFGDADVLEIKKIADKVAHEALYIKQFVRFQKAADGIYFAPVKPVCNALPLVIDHFNDRFGDQPWIIYDMRRNYGYYYDLRTVREISLSKGDPVLRAKLDESLLAADEKLFQNLWKGYFEALTIKERINPRLHRKNLPVRFWSLLPEKEP